MKILLNDGRTKVIRMRCKMIIAIAVVATFVLSVIPLASDDSDAYDLITGDGGVGYSIKNLSEEDLDKIWIKFYKVDKARTREYGGSGIGLSLVAATMEAHGKDYGVGNLEDGVDFWFDLDRESL